jgi:hypothetical protein
MRSLGWRAAIATPSSTSRGGKPVKFATIARLMKKMGYSDDSPEMADMALLWVESVSGVPLAAPGKVREARQKPTSYQRETQRLTTQLAEAIRHAGLSEREVRLLEFAARRPEVLEIIGAVHDLVQAAQAETAAPHLKVAEEK